MKTVLMMQSKGGSGKTTLLLEVLQRLGGALIDLDRNTKTATTFVRQAKTYAKQYGIAALNFSLVASMGEARAARAQLLAYDTPAAFSEIGELSDASKAFVSELIEKADLILCPVRNSIVELTAFNSLIDSLLFKLPTPVPSSKIMVVPSFVKQQSDIEFIESIVAVRNLEPMNVGGLPFYDGISQLHSYGQLTSSGEPKNGALAYQNALRPITDAIAKRLNLKSDNIIPLKEVA